MRQIVWRIKLVSRTLTIFLKFLFIKLLFFNFRRLPGGLPLWRHRFATRKRRLRFRHHLQRVPGRLHNRPNNPRYSTPPTVPCGRNIGCTTDKKLPYQKTVGRLHNRPNNPRYTANGARWPKYRAHNRQKNYPIKKVWAAKKFPSALAESAKSKGRRQG
jgi:hypothetical protein